MELKQVKGIGPAKQAKLREAGIEDVESLARADVAQLAKATGFSEASVKEYRERATALLLLQDVRGVGPATVKVLAESGIRSLQEFTKASADRIAAELKVAKAKVQKWQDDASELAQRVAQDAKTKEGRARLVREGKQAAAEAVERGEKATKALVERLRKDSERLVAQAQRVREQAPAKAKELRAKADGLLAKADAKRHDLEERARRLGEQAGTRLNEIQAKVKAEAEKVRAANEGLVKRVKSRWSRTEDIQH